MRPTITGKIIHPKWQSFLVEDVGLPNSTERTQYVVQFFTASFSLHFLMRICLGHLHVAAQPSRSRRAVENFRNMHPKRDLQKMRVFPPPCPTLRFYCASGFTLLSHGTSSCPNQRKRQSLHPPQASCPGLEFLLAAAVPVKSCTVPRRHGRTPTNQRTPRTEGVAQTCRAIVHCRMGH